MKPSIVTFALLLFLGNIVYSQDFIYSRNYVGEMEVYQGLNGSPNGQPIGKFKKNYLGNIEYYNLTNDNSLNFRQSTNPTTDLPVLVPVVPQFAPIASILNSLNAYQQLLKSKKQQVEKQNYSEEGVAAFKLHYQQMNEQFKDLQSFYGKVTNKPSHINNGWHNVTLLSSDPMKEIVNNAMHLNVDKNVELGYAFVVDNKIQKLIIGDNFGGANYLVPNIISTNIDACKAFYKFKGSNSSYDNEVFFLDYIMDSTIRATPPQLGTATFNLGIGATKVVIGFFKQDPIKYPDIDNVCILILLKDKNSEKTLGINKFISQPGVYYYHALDVNKRTWDGTILLVDDFETTTTLSY